MSRAVEIHGDTAYVTLTKGYVATIDAVDVPLIDGSNWSALTSSRRKAVYAVRVRQSGGVQKMLLMHRVILGVDCLDVDHIDGDGLNNRRANLRRCTRGENNLNVGLRSDNKSGFKGVFFDARSGRWRSEITRDGKSKYLGLFDTPDEAAAAYAAAAPVVHGSFARLK